MAITKPPILPVWADSGDKVQPSDAEIQTGWPLTNVPPARQRFNWFFNFVSNAVRYFSRRGLPDWDAAETYSIGDCVIGPDNKTYRSLTNSNINQTPASNADDWEPWALSGSDLGASIQEQKFTAWTTSGTAPNYDITPTPAITSYKAGQRFRIKMHSGNNNAASTLNVSGLGDKALQIRLLTGLGTAALNTPNLAAGHLIDVEYNGTGFELVSERGAVQATTALLGVTQLATAVQILAGTAGLTMTPDQFISGWSNDAGGGNINLPGGWILNYGWVNVSDNGYTGVTFRKAYTDTPFVICSPAKSAAVTSSNLISAHAGNVTTTGASIGASSNNDAVQVDGVYWFAIGR